MYLITLLGTANDAKLDLVTLKNEQHLFLSNVATLSTTVPNCGNLLNADKIVELKRI